MSRIPNIGVTQFARRRHTATSAYSHFSGTEAELCRLVEAHWESGTPGRANGCMEVVVPPEGFFSAVVKVDSGTVLKALFTARDASEAPYLQFRAVGGQKLPARRVVIIVYTKEEAGKYADPDGPAWQIASINASPGEFAEPPHPMAMARNMAGLTGGSVAVYTADEFVRAIIYWSDKCMREAEAPPKA